MARPKTHLEKLSEAMQAQPRAFQPIQPDIPTLAEQRRIREEAWETRLGALPPPLIDPTGGGGGGYRPLTFAQTEAGIRLAASLAQDTERFAGTKRLELEETLHALAMDLLPPADVETAMKQVRRGELVKSKLAFQAVLQNLADEAAHAERRADLDLQEENEARTLREARATITIDMLGRNVGAAILFALGASE